MYINYKIIIIFAFIGVYFSEANSLKKIEFGEASYYGDKYQGKLTANGDKYDKNKLTAAHKTLPFGTLLKVTNLKNSKSIQVVVNDRGPFVPGRIIDLSRRGAIELDYVVKGLAEVKIEIVNNKDNKVINPSSTANHSSTKSLKKIEIENKNKISILEKELENHKTKLQAINFKFKELNSKYNNFKKKCDSKELNNVSIKKVKHLKNIQLGMFSNYSNALLKQKKTKNRINNEYPIEIIKQNKNNKSIYQVKILNIENKNLTSFIKKYKLRDIYIR